MDTVKDLIIKVENLKQNKKFKEALKLLKDVILNYCDDYRIYEEIADIYLYEGNLVQAKKAVNFALSLNKDSATGNYLKGFILLSNNKSQESIKYLEKSNMLMGNNAEVLRNLGWGYCMVGEQEKGILILKRALNISPGDELITEDLAMALIGAGNVKDGNLLLSKIGKNYKK
ncbi:MAG: hypothetical protein PHN31_00295 [Candidatus Gracilibacteria bacterium]|nr:hypothetical protein [Candidatus Gracilibacteria bacterium]